MHRWILAVAQVAVCACSVAYAQPATQNSSELPPAAGGPVRLRQPALAASAASTRAAEQPRAPLYVPGEFERFVHRQTGTTEVRRFGAEVMIAAGASSGAEVSPLVPPDYIVAPGDELQVSLWGSVDADLQLTVDRTGRIHIPRVGSIVVAGVRHADLTDSISRRVAQVFKNYQISVSLGALRGVRVFVTGFAVGPGAYSLSSLSSITTVLARAGGPSAAGSFRDVELRRANKVEARFDLYDFMLKGDRSADRLVQAGDVVHVNPVGTQIAVIGSVNHPAIFELKAGETVGDALRMSGGFSAVADRTRLGVERLDERSTLRVTQLALPQGMGSTLGHGDVVRAFSAVDAVLPVERQNKRVRIEGEVQRPGDYVLPPESTLADALRAAGGITGAAFVFGTEFARDSVRRSQQENYDRALRDLETDSVRASASRRTTTGEEAQALSVQNSATSRLMERLRALRPTGRIVLQLQPESAALPDLALEDGDGVYIPARPTTVGVFGSVFNAGSYLHGGGRTLGDYVRLAGGATKGADGGSMFVVRANGSVVSARQSGAWFRDGSISELASLPGDTVFVPEELDKSTWMQHAKDWTLILYQLGLGAAGIRNALGY